MSKKSRALKKAREAHRDGHATAQTVTKVRDPADLIAMVPFLFGFQPVDSLVVVSLEGSRRRVGPSFRVDLPGDPGHVADEVDYLCRLARQHRFAAVVLVVYSSDRERASRIVETLLEALRRDQVEVVDALRADGRRWWSYTCTNPACCPADGTPYDADSSPAAADAVYAGMQRAPSRDSLREQFEPASEDVRAEVSRAAATSQPPSPAEPERFDDRLATGLRDPDALQPVDVAWLARAVTQEWTLRDRAWTLMTRADADRHLELWGRIMREVPDELLSSPGSLAAFAAWLSGRGVLAAHAVERVLSVDPDCRMALLLLDVLERAVSPQEWTRLQEATVARPARRGHP